MGKSIIEFVKEYQANDRLYAIPEFQRAFRWKDHQVEDLFDSIFRSYPLPRFFVWSVTQNTPVSLFKISNDFTIRPVNSVQFRENEYQATGHIAICDGQQRLTSILIGMLGLNFPKTARSRNERYLYFDIFSNTNTILNFEEDNQNNDENKKRFQFLTQNEARVENELHDAFWVKVSDFYNFYNENDNLPQRQILQNFMSNLRLHEFATNENVQLGIDNLRDFLSSISQRDYLDFQNLQPIIGAQLKEAVEFFKRINAKGVQLSANEILFALVSRHLENENYNHIHFRNDLISLSHRYCNNNDGIFRKDISWDFYLRTCLYLTSNDILFKVNSFNQNVCTNILDNWPNIKVSIECGFNLIRELHLNDIIVSINSLIPVIYHLYKKDNQIIDNQEEREILKYLIRAQFSNVFGSHGDSLLTSLKNNQRNKYENINYRFSFNDLNINLPPDKSFSVSLEKIDALLNREYNDSKIKPILSLITEGTNTNATYQVDHIHPESICTSDGQLMHNDVVADINFIKENYNKLPNLQLLINNCNQSKNNTPFLEWMNQIIQGYHNNNNDLSCLNGRDNIEIYLRENLINRPQNISIEEFLHIRNFRLFFETRKELIRNRLLVMLINN